LTISIKGIYSVKISSKFACCILGQGTYWDCLYLWVVRLVLSCGSSTRKIERSHSCLVAEVPIGK